MYRFILWADIDYVIHVAGPFDLKSADYHTEMIEPILAGQV